MAAYERLSSLDQAFLSFESATTPMHIALVAVFEHGSLNDTEYGIDLERIRRHVASRLHLCSRYRQRLATSSLTGVSMWVDDDQFDLRWHVRHVALPEPGRETQLRRCCERILEQPLARDRPLWEIWIIDGLERRRFAMLTKVHHCLVDGIGGVGLLGTVLGLAPEAGGDPGPDWNARPGPRVGETLGAEVRRRARQLADLGHALRDPAKLVRGVGWRAAALQALLADGLGSTPTTAWNAPVGRHRHVRWISFPLAEVKTVKQALGGTVNDVILATVAGGVRRLLHAEREPSTLDGFKVAVPVNCRDAHDAPTGNCSSIWMLPLPLAEADVRRRLQTIAAATAELKARGRAAGVQVLAEAAEWVGPRLSHLAVRLIARTSFYNLLVTNVPGPGVPLHLLDARMVSAYPYVPLFPGQGLGIAIFSYRGRVTWGLTANPETPPDLAEVGRAIEEAFGELRLAAAAARAGTVERRGVVRMQRSDAPSPRAVA